MCNSARSGRYFAENYLTTLAMISSPMKIILNPREISGCNIEIPFV